MLSVLLLDSLAIELPPPGAPPVVDDADYRVRHAMQLEPVSEDQVVREKNNVEYLYVCHLPIL